MTPERKKYLECCSEAELAIRTDIGYRENTIKTFKGLLNSGIGPAEYVSKRKKRIAENQATIKALKKHLPGKAAKYFIVPVKSGDEIQSGYACLTCQSWVMHGEAPVEERPKYCPWCGQKLRYESHE